MAKDTIVIFGSSITALAVARTAARCGMRVVVVDENKGIAMRSRYVKSIVVSRSDPDKALEMIGNRIEGKRALCVADCDDWLNFIQENRSSVESFFGTVLHPSQETLAICLDKNRFLGWCKEQGIRAPEKFELDENGEIAGPPKFPILLRPERTQHNSGKDLPKAVEVRSFSELRIWSKRFLDLKVKPSACESLLRPGVRQYSAGFARRRDGFIRIALAEKIRSVPIQCLGGTYVISSFQANIEKFVREAVVSMDYFGFGEAEVMYDANTRESYIIEINARPWVQYALAERIFPGMFDFLTGEAPNPEEEVEPWNRHARWLNFGADLFVCFSRTGGIVRHGHYSLQEYFASILNSNTFAFYDTRDLLPFLYDGKRMIGVLWDGLMKIIGSYKR